MPEGNVSRLVRAVSEYGRSPEAAEAVRIPLGPLRMLIARPPYKDATRVESVPMRASRGTVAILEGPGWERPQKLPGLFWHLRLRCGITPVVRLSPNVLLAHPNIAARYQAAGAHAVIVENGPMRGVLRRVLSRSASLEDYWLDRVWAMDPALPAAIRPSLAAIIRVAGEGVPISEVLAQQGVSARTARSWQGQAGLPKLTCWATAAKLLRAQLRLQSDRHLSIGQVAREFGYSEARSLSNEIYRYFDCSAALSRDLLGLDWRLLIWWKRFSR